MPFDSSGRKRSPSPSSPSSITASSGGASLPAARGWVGSHSTNFSPSSDCGRIRQEASSRKSWKPGSSIRSTSTARPGCGLPSACAASVSLVTVTSSTTPTLAPAIRTSSPGTMKAPLSKIARTV